MPSPLQHSGTRPLALAVTLAVLACGPDTQLTSQRESPQRAQPSAGALDPTPDEQAVVDLVNATRANSNLAPLQWAPGLVAYARSHALKMAARGDIFHDPDAARKAFVADGWTRFAENVGMASSPEAVHRGLMRSRGHRGNILGDFTQVTVGAARDENDDLFVTELFARRVPPLPASDR